MTDALRCPVVPKPTAIYSIDWFQNEMSRRATLVKIKTNKQQTRLGTSKKRLPFFCNFIRF